MSKKVLHCLYCLLLLCWQPVFAQTLAKNRLIVLSDIEAEVDDTESFIRLLLYANQIDIKGMIATTSVWKKNSTAPQSLVALVKAYSKVRPNLLKHEIGFPEASELLQLVKSGPPVYCMLGVGKGKDSEGSDWIIKVLEDNDERPLWVAVWGGANTLAQALNKIRDTKSAAEARRMISKLRVYTISDQDDSGIWIRNNFPDLFYIVSPGDDYGSATWSAINSVIKGIDNTNISNSWLEANIQQGHGALGASYPDVAYGVEGDTPSFLSLISNGLNEPGHPEWGGWGGRYELYKPDFTQLKKGTSGVPFEPETRPIWTNAVDNYTPYIANEFGRAVKPDTIHYKDSKATLWRWRSDFQQDFAARMDWCVKPYEQANHPPVAAIQGSEFITVKSGEGVYLNASSSTDPDGDNLTFLWFGYPEAGSYKKAWVPEAENSHQLYLAAPVVAAAETAHIILKVTDKGSPALSRYKRVIVTIVPK